MDKLFMTVLNMSLTGAFVIAAVILARLPLKKAPKIISYCLWAVVGFRLICPFTIESVLSLMPIKSEPIPIYLSSMEHSDVISSIDSGSSVVDGTIETMLTYARTSVSGNPYSAMTRVISYAWLIGSAAMLLYGIVSYALLKRRMRTAIRVEGNLYEMDNIQSPFVLGIIKPKIYLPLSLVAGERDYIILHERTHIRRRDHIIKFAAYFILCPHWFNPLVWAAFLLMGVDMEMSCDERVLKEMGGETKHDYSRSLLSLATQRRVIGGSPLAFGEGGVKGRVKNVLNFRKPSRVIIIAAVALVAVLSIGFAVNRADKHDHIEFEAIYNDITEYSSTLQFKHGKIVYSCYIVNGEIQSVNDWHDYKEIGYAADDFGKFRIFERKGYSSDKFIVVQDYGFMNGATIYASDDVTSAPTPITDTVSIVVWKDTDNQTRYSLFDGDVTPAPSEFSSGRVFNDTPELNAALAVYPQNTLSMVHVDHTLDFTKEEMISITEQFIIPSGNYSMATGLYEFHITTLDEAREIVGEHYPGWPDITFIGEDTISYTNPPKPVEVYKFEVVVSGLVETCAVSKERGIFFNYSNRTWFAFTGLAEWNGATQNMTLDDVRAIAQKIGPDLAMGDLRDFTSTDIGSGIFVMQYYIENSDYMLIVGSGDMNTVMYANLIHATDGGTNESIDIRYYDVDNFITDETKELVRPLPVPQKTAPPHDPGYFTDPVQAVKSELEVDGCVILDVFAVGWIVEQSASDGRDYDVVTIYAEYLDGPFSDAIYVMKYTMRRPADDNAAEWTHDEPVFWEGIAYGVAKYAAEQYYAETGRTVKIADMRPISIEDNTAYVPSDKRNWHTVVFNIEYENDPISHPQQIAVLISQDGQSRWQVVYWSGITQSE